MSRTAGARNIRPLIPVESLDAQIERLYQQRERGALQRFCKRYNVPAHQVRRRALALGVIQTRVQDPPWSEAETDLLEAHVGLSAPAIYKRLLKAGYRRSETAIASKRKRLGLRVTGNGVYTARALARIMGVKSNTVVGWIERGWLKAQRRGTLRCAAQGGDHHEITAAQVRRFIIGNVGAVDLARIDKFWLIDLLAGRGGPG